MNSNFIVGEEDDEGFIPDELTNEIIKIFKDYNVELKPEQIKSNNDTNEKKLPAKDESDEEEEHEEYDDDDVLYGEDEYGYEDNDTYSEDDDEDDEDNQDLNKNNNNDKNYLNLNTNNNNFNINNNNNNILNKIFQNYNNELSTVKKSENSFFSPITTIINNSREVIDFLNSQNISTLGSLAVIEDDSLQVLSYSIEYSEAETIKVYQEISRDVIKASQNEHEPRSFINPNFQVHQINESSSILVLFGTSLNDENNLKKLGIHTIGQLAESKDRVIISADSRFSLFAFMAKRFLDYIKKHPEVLIAPLNSNNLLDSSRKKNNVNNVEKSRIVYFYCSLEVADIIAMNGFIKSPKVLFEEYMNAPSEARFNHLWRKVYFSFRLAASKHCKNTDPSDLDVYSYLVWRTASSRGLSADNCISGVKAITCFYSPIPPGVDLGVYSDEFEVKIPVNLDNLLKDPSNQFYYCTKDETYPTLINKDIWLKATDNDISREISSNSWLNYVDGQDPKLTVPHCSIITSNGKIQVDSNFKI